MGAIRLAVLPLFALYLMACDDEVELESPTSNEGGLEVVCPAETGGFDHLVGLPYMEVKDQFPVGDRLFGLREPGKIYTMEAVFGRTLVYVDENGVITRIRCG